MGRAAIYAVVALAIMPSQAFAWGAAGHEIVAEIAAHELTANARRQVSELLGGAPDAAMIDASTWADKIRGSRPNTAPWHSVHVELGSTGYEARRDCPRDACVVGQIERDERILADRRLLPPVRAEALRFLIHFVGDLHQPLHVAEDHDRNANDLSVLLGRRHTNLHAVWDDAVLRPLGRNPIAAGDRLEADIRSADRQRWQTGDPASWATESFTIAKQDIYPAPASFGGNAPLILPGDYVGRKQDLVSEQLKKAGVRLAAVLNRILN